MQNKNRELTKKFLKPGQKLCLDLTAAEREIVLTKLLCLDAELEEAVKNSPPVGPLLLTLDDLAELAGHVSAAANHAGNRKLERALDGILAKIDYLIQHFIEQPEVEEPAAQLQTELGDFAPLMFALAEQARIKLTEMLAKEVRRKPSGKKSKVRKIAASDKFTVQLTLSQRLAVAELQPQLADRLKLKEKNERACEFSPEEAEIVKEAAFEAIPNESSGMKRNSLRHIEQKLHDALSRVVAASQAYQFKITLKESKPPIWRRIQVQACTLDKLHEHIQTAVGWTNSHLHQFKIDGQYYGDPLLLEENFEEMNIQDSTTTGISDILPQDGARFAFNYEYDFGDSWEHDVLFEGWMEVQSGTKYPICLEGERACPPEDVGGIGGYKHFLAAIADPKHKEHKSLLRWCGGKFSPESFDPARATKAMNKGLPDWRETM